MGNIDLNAVRLSQDFSAMARTEKLLVVVPVRKPAKHQFVRVHPDEAYRLEVGIIEIAGDDTYLVHPAVVSAVPELVKPVRLHLYVTRQGTPALWPVKLPGEDGKTNHWYASAAEAAEVAMKKWIRLVANREGGADDVIVAESIPKEPVWPDKTMEELVNKAFAGRFIDSEKHPVVRELLGVG